MARMSGAIPAAQVNVQITNNHVVQTLQVAIFSSLAPFPEARQAVLLALETIEHEEPGR